MVLAGTFWLIGRHPSAGRRGDGIRPEGGHGAGAENFLRRGVTGTGAGGV